MSVFRRDHHQRKTSDALSSLSLSGDATGTSRSVSPGSRADSATLGNELGHDSANYEESTHTRPGLSIKKRFTSSWAQRRRNKDDEDGTKSRGPLGLRLLHSSPEPLMDLIFVHGLRGASIKTWQKGNDPRFFWPQFWLPIEQEFHHVNIHSFGYDADWKSSNASILNVHDFGQSLLEEMRNSPHLRSNADAPIILLGHSMGGLVIKKAFILSKEVPELDGRIKCIFFLATPHRGSDYAGIFKNILSASGVVPSHQFMADLTTSSVSAQLLNDDFGRCVNNIPIFSFYETLPMSIGITSAIVVEKASAILGPGYRHERVQYLNANHKDICKFESQEDPNYITLKNALGGAVHTLLRDVSKTQREKLLDQMKTLRSYLGVADQPDEQYSHVEGSCRWIDSRDDFQEWRDSAADFITDDPEDLDVRHNLSLYWVHANPGTGKTYLASHVISELISFRLECAYHFFHISSKGSRSLAGFLRSISYQMALSNAAIREKLVRLCQDGSSFDMDDALTIWTKLFKKGILQASVMTTQYLVIDALDECFNYQEFFTMLKGVSPSFPWRIFITSRNISDMQRLYRPLETTASITTFEIPQQNSIEDIEKYIQSRIDNLSIDSTADREELARKVLQRSNASFLWVRLVLDELEQIYSQESIMEVLDGIPEGMMPYYERTVRAMAENKKEKHIAKAVLVWVVASTRKLTIPELSNALKLDIKTHLPSAKSAVIGLCGQLVTVDKATGVVDVIHPTAREFLLSEAAGEFAISKSQADQRLALTCLQLLSSAELQPPRNRRFLAPQQKHTEPSPLLDYALTQFSEHVFGASSETDDLLVAVDRFFRTNALSWVEHVAQKGDLHCLIRASKNFKAYLDRRAKYRSPLSDQVRNVEAWSVDLGRLVTKFGSALLKRPSSIYFLIPPLCPSHSAISRQFGRRPDGLAVVGFKNEEWDDCIATIGFGDDAPSYVSCGESLVAVGMDSGDVNIYNHWSYQKEKVLHLKHAVDLVHLADNRIVACTTRMITLRDLEGNTIWEHRIRFRCILLTSSTSEVIAVAQHGLLLRWDIKDGTPLDSHMFPYRPFDSDPMQDEGWGRAPFLASISPDLEVLALGYRGGAVCLWELGSNELIGWARDDEDRLASKLIFNPNPEVGLLLVIYTNHNLSLYDSWSGSLVNAHETPNHVGLLSASCSPDGRTLATIDMRGNMQIWDFSSLTLLYHVLCPHSSFRILSFTSDGSSIVDVMDSNMRVWSPSVLVRKNIEEDQSVSDDAPHLEAKEGQYESSRTSRITAICSHPSLPVVFAGKYTGQIIAFNTRNGQEMSTLYSHSSAAFITELAVSKQNAIASSDVFGIVQVRKLVSGKAAQLESQTVLLQRPAGAPIRQLAFTLNGDFLLISRTLFTEVYSMKDLNCVGTLAINSEQDKIWRWLPLPAGDQFLMICDDKIRSYSAHKFPERTDSFTLSLNYMLPEGSVATTYKVDGFHNGTHVLILGVTYELGCVTSSATFLFDLKNGGKEQLTNVTPTHRQCFDTCKLFLGYAPRMQSYVVLQRDSWVSTIAIKNLATNEPKQHFYVPDDYMTTGHDVVPVKTAEDDIVFCLHGELAIVRNGLKS